MMFIYYTTFQKPKEEKDRLLPEHFRYLAKYYEQGTFICSGPQVNGNGGVIVARCKDRQEAEAIMREDPFHQEGIAACELIEFNPVKYSKDFEPFLPKD